MIIAFSKLNLLPLGQWISKNKFNKNFLSQKSLEVVLRPQKEDLLTTKKSISICYKGYAPGENDLPQAELNLSLTNSENFTGRFL